MKKRQLFNDISAADCAVLLFLAGFVYCFVHIGISMYQMIKDIYYYTGCCALIMACMIFRRAKLFRIGKIVFGVLSVAVILEYQFIHRNDWGYQYRDMLIAKHLMYVLFALAVWVFIEEKTWKYVRARTGWFTSLFFIAFFAAIVFGKQYVVSILIPIAVIYTLPMSKEVWKKFLTMLTGASYSVFAFVMTLSLVVKPDGFSEGRYIGLFVFPAIAGVLASLALLSGYWLWKNYAPVIEKKSFRVGLLALMWLYPLFSLVYVFNRASVVSIIIVAMLFFVVGSEKNRSSHAKRRGIVILAIFLFGIASWIGIIKVLQNCDLSRVKSFLQERTEAGNDQGLYIISRIVSTVTNKESKTGIFEPGTLMNAIDTMSSTRMGIWYLGLKNVRWLGGSELSVVLPRDEEFVAHTHNTYLDILLRLGIVGGGIMIIWFFAYIIEAARRYIEYDDSVFFTMIWSFFCIFFFLVERELWTNLPAFLLIMLQYPLVMRFTDDVT